MLSVDNKNIESSIVELDCENQKEKIGFCTSNVDGLMLTIQCMKTWKSVFKIVSEALYSDIRDITIELLYAFSKKFYTEVALDLQPNKENWWSNVQLISESFLDSEDAVHENIAKSKQYAFILYLSSGDFASFEAAIHFHRVLNSLKLTGGIVDCKHHSDICEKNSVDHQGSPVLIAYQDSEKYQTYDGEFTEKKIKDWSRRIQQSVIAQLSESIVPKYRSGIVPGFDEIVDTVTMMFVADKKDPIYKNFRKFARENHGKYHFASMVDQGISRWAHNPALVTVKPYDEYSKAFTLYDDLSWDTMVKYLEEGTRPSIHEIENSGDFLYALSARQPLVIFYDPTKTKNPEQFNRLASTYEVRQDEAVFGAIRGLSLFGIYLTQNLIPDFLRSNYIMLEKDHGDMHLSLCVRTKLINEETSKEIHIWLKDVKLEKCIADIDPYVMSLLEKIALFERMEKVRDAISDEEKSVTQRHDEL
ncbi:hypothetical protein WR25_10872 [Diploscapter pachys]|uniref:Thioredoxin domain-containing protein n=1 Tax=Diploscapter pachys TaxID=2018661 RepID=A0A2A2LZ79_9BILA|nr:hypothetical protein WR25_10872 [Diploscapter pachys]